MCLFSSVMNTVKINTQSSNAKTILVQGPVLSFFSSLSILDGARHVLFVHSCLLHMLHFFSQGFFPGILHFCFKLYVLRYYCYFFGMVNDYFK